MHLPRQFVPSATGISLTAAILLASVTTSPACTTMVLGPPRASLVAYSYDQAGTGSGVLLVNPAGTIRTSIMDDPRAAWQARFASVSFNQFGLGMPVAGMNTEGLVVTLMWNDDVSYPPPDRRPGLNELEVIQLILDTSATVADALDNLDDVRVAGMVPIHYFLADAGGDAAAVAYLDGDPVIRQGLDLPVRALANTSYDVALARFGDDPAATGTGSQGRFARAALASRQATQPVSPAQAFGFLSEVHTSETRWNIVFDPGTRTLAFRTVESPRIRTFSLADIDGACRPAPLSVDVNAGRTGAVTAHLQPFMPADNAALTAEAFSSMPHFADLGPGFPALAAAAQYASAQCPGP